MLGFLSLGESMHFIKDESVPSASNHIFLSSHVFAHTRTRLSYKQSMKNRANTNYRDENRDEEISARVSRPR